ncbi:MAG: Ig-like domain-containing protein [Clostridiales bacterium]|nr:Ig-like domain-containing protein [Clostridiales bacterium]
MRKTVIALLLVIPMLFVLVIFSAINVVSLSVDVSVNDIRLLVDDYPQDTALLIDMADSVRHKLSAEVLPSNATEKGYTLSSSNPDVEIDSNGNVIAHREGNATITATSKDKGYTDTVEVIAVSSKAYDVRFALFDTDGDEISLSEKDNEYSARVEAGLFGYSVAIEPSTFTQYTLVAANGDVAEVDQGVKTVLLPFSGTTALKLTVPDAIGTLEKTVKLTVTKPSSTTGIIVNGVADSASVLLSTGETETRLYVECDGDPIFESSHATVTEKTPLGGNRYLLDVEFHGVDVNDDTTSFDATISYNHKTATVFFNFRSFDFNIHSSAIAQNSGDNLSASILSGKKATFYAVPAAQANGVSYEWTVQQVSGGLEANGIKKTVGDDSKSCDITAPLQEGEFVLRVQAYRNNTVIAEHYVTVSVELDVTAISILNNTTVGLGECYTIAGYRYENSVKVANEYEIQFVIVFSDLSTSYVDGDRLIFSVSDQTVATVTQEDGRIWLVPQQTGKVTLTIEWKGNETFGRDVKTSLSLYVVKDAVAVSNAPQLVKAMQDRDAAVLTANIKLGTDENGNVLSIEERKAMLGVAKSTYNIEWYKATGQEDKANINYALEFTNDVYGNGKSIDADNFTHAVDGTGMPLIFTGPLSFVQYNGVASVAGQDNCAFLMRTDGVKLYDVSLFGCSNESLTGENDYDLSNLNNVGTTLDINASVDIINCRISNGRNVVRIYGGNRDGNNYFINSLMQNNGCDYERITVNIEGCIIYQAREFLLKVGANRALQANETNAEPPLTDANGNAYSTKGAATTNNYGSLYNDEYFYRMYVMTDVTLKNSVLETSGLFAIGIESNFAGDFLYGGAGDNDLKALIGDSWQHSGGTSFASVLNLVGDVRIYDWKDLSLVDSSTLIESPAEGVLSGWLKLDISGMINYVVESNPLAYGQLITPVTDKQYVHGGIAVYGGGRNYSQVVLDGLNAELNDFTHVNINIKQLADSPDENLSRQGTLLPYAAGTNDFNFFMYTADCNNNYGKQQSDIQNGVKYSGVVAVSIFD